MRARLREACDGLGWFIGPGLSLLVFSGAMFLLVAVTETAVEQPVHLDTADWIATLFPAVAGLAVIVAGFIHRHIERNPRYDEFGFGYGLDPEFIERELEQIRSRRDELLQD